MTNRRLAAILFTDIQGYTALMQKSEAKALHIRNLHREIFEREHNRYNGEVIQYFGDGTLSIFNSAVDAVKCAVAMQRSFREEADIPVRIGIHSGDIMMTDQDIVGDSVNIASRLESLAIAGSVLISDKVRDEIKNHGEIRTVPMGKFRLKNVNKPVSVHAVSNEGLIVPDKMVLNGKGKNPERGKWRIPIGITFIAILVVALWILQGGVGQGDDKQVYESIAVLPFDNFTGRPDLDYFVEGMHASLIGDLGKVDALRVISPTTARSYRNSGKSVREIAKELNVDVVLEASVFCLGDSVCIQPKLISAAKEEKQLWVEDYYQDKKQILRLYNQLTKEISNQVNVTLTPEEEGHFADAQEIDPEAYDLYLRGQYNLMVTDPESLFKAKQYFEAALEIEPLWAGPYGGLSSVVGYQKQFGIIKPSEAIPQMEAYLQKAVELDPNSAETHYQLAVHAVWSEYDWEKGEAEFRKCLELNPNHALGQMFYAHLLTIQRRTEEAIPHAQKSVEVDPNNPLILGLHTVVLVEAGECEKALVECQKALSIEPDHYFSKTQLKRAYACLGDYDKAFESWKTANLRLWERYGVTGLYENAYLNGGWLAAQEEAIRINEEYYLKDGRMAYAAQGTRFAMVGNAEKAVEIWEKALELNDPNLPYISCQSTYEMLKDEPVYTNFLKKMNLPI